MQSLKLRKTRVIAVLLAVLMVAAIIPVTPAMAVTTSTTVSYTPDFSTVISNPERGWHNRYEIIVDKNVNPYVDASKAIPGFVGDASAPDYLEFKRAKLAGNTLIHSYIHLDYYRDVATLPPALFASLRSGLDAIRAAGLKIVLRPAYSWAESLQHNTPMMLGHIEQINAVLCEYSDIILHLETGYIGPWGEWHSNDFAYPDKVAHSVDRYKVVQKILQTTPDNIPVCIRNPTHVKEISWWLPNNPNSATEPVTPLTQTQIDRIGFHNDAFLAGEEDCGTYTNSIWWGEAAGVGNFPGSGPYRQWMYDMKTSFGTNTMFGGETMEQGAGGWDGPDGAKVQSEMYKLHCTEMNTDFADEHITIWRNNSVAASGNDPAETIYKRLSRKMGYRLRLIDATFTNSAQWNDDFSITAKIANDGYAGVVKERPIFVVLYNGSYQKVYPLSDIDVRKWTGGEGAASSYTIPTTKFRIPTDMPEGVYTVALWLPDLAEGLRSRPEYSIRFANGGGVWDSAKGMNKLGSISVLGSDPTIPPAPQNLQASIDNASSTLTWDGAPWANSYSVYYSTASGGPYTLAASGVTATTYKVIGLVNGTKYYFVVSGTNNLGTSPYSSEANATPSADLIPPSVPTNLAVTGTTVNSVSLSWTASTDNVAVGGYEVFRNGTFIATVTGTTYTDNGLNPNTTYQYSVRAFDTSMNFSARCADVPATTLKNLSVGYMIEDFTRSNSMTQNNTGGSNNFQNGNIIANALEWNGAWCQMNFNSGQLPNAKYFVLRMKGASGGELSDIEIQLGGKSGSIASFTTDQLSTGSFTDIVIDIAASGMTASNTWQNFTFFKWNAPSSWKVWFDAIYLADEGGVITTAPTTAPTTTTTTTTTAVPTTTTTTTIHADGYVFTWFKDADTGEEISAKVTSGLLPVLPVPASYTANAKTISGYNCIGYKLNDTGSLIAGTSVTVTAGAVIDVVFYYKKIETTTPVGHPEYVVMRIDNLYAAVNGVKTKVNDDQDLAPIFNTGGRTMVPFRFIATAFGADVDWDGDSGSAIIDYNGKHIAIPIGEPYAYVDGVKTPINAPAEIMTFGRTFVPFRAVAELLGDVVLDYDSPTETIVAAKAPIEGQYNLAYYVGRFNTICG